MKKPVRFREDVLRRLDEMHMTPAELSRRSGVSSGTIYKLLQREGATTAAENARAIAEVLEIDGDFGTANATSDPDLSVLVPVYDIQASAGPGLIPMDYVPVTRMIAFAADYLRNILGMTPQNAGLVAVSGDSMEVTFRHGDLVIMDMSAPNFDTPGIYVFRHDETVHIKRVTRSSRAGHILAIPDNKHYPNQEYQMGEVGLIGRVKGRMGVV